MMKNVRINKKTLNLGNILRYIILSLIALLILFPFFIMLLKSFMTDDDVLMLPIKIFPSKFTFKNYIKAFDVSLVKYFGNTLLVVGVSIIAIPITASLCAFGFARIKFKGRELAFGVVLATLMLPSIVVQVPLYVIFYKFKWLNTLLPLIVPTFFGGGAMNIFLFRQYIRAIPFELDNAARIDGANLFQIYSLICLPMSMSVMVFIAINTFIGGWNDFAGPLMYIWNENKYTLAVGVYKKYIESSIVDFSLANLKMAVGVILTIPPAILFFIFQKQIISGISVGGLK